MTTQPSLLRDQRLALPQVTLCAATSVNVKATLRALEVSLAQVDFAACKLFTDAPVTLAHPGISIVRIPKLNSSAEYSNFLLSQMVDHVETSHCLVAQWDGHVLDSRRWRPEFLDYDYIGASWPQFDDGHDVGNGGFSLRSRRLMETCRHPLFCVSHPEDLAIGRLNRDWLEGMGMRFAPREIADLFATERTGDLEMSFGYHGAWLMPHTIGVVPFWTLYRDLDDRKTIRHDFSSILKDMGCGPGGSLRMVQMIFDRMKHKMGLGR
ncbi:DUF5672 family protein [Sphingobium fuliginis]|uniref:DUF5672 domain-containing protein n=1 Tax=Sphingobium fuliginis ATCC 27551 TaxID=1208342 RepID=A0A5B8CLP4_SPHSA|nr:DUF5672 family protein [Sphingobium fuliginis]QDC38081.1 hypothetical protein FIL70_13470 [Sphingobium fuliginis ATCC 27551]